MRVDNYWEGSSSPNAPRKPTTPADIIAMRKAGQQPTEQQIQEALAYLDQQPMDIGPKIGRSDPFSPQVADPGYKDPFQDRMRSNMPNDPAMMRKTLTPFKPPVGPQDISKVSTIGGNLLSIADSILGGGNAPQDPNSIWSSLSSQNPLDAYLYHGPSAQDMASQEFQPQFDLLSEIAKGQTSRYNTNKGEISGLYNALVNDTKQGANEINSVFKDATNQINANGAQAASNVSGNFDKSGDALMGEMARLGLNEGAPDLAAKKQEVLTNALQALSGQQQSAANMETQLGANAFAYGRERADINQQAGVNELTDLLGSYNQAQDQNNYQRLGLESQKQSAINKYLMDIAGMNQQGQTSWNDDIQKRMDSILGYNQGQSDLELRRAGLDLQAQKQGGADSLNPYDALMQRSMNTYGGDAASANGVVQELLSTWQSHPTATPGELMASLNQDTLRSNPQLAALAFEFFNRVGVKAK